MVDVGLDEFTKSTPKIGPIDYYTDESGKIVPTDPNKNPFKNVEDKIAEWNKKLRNKLKASTNTKANVENNSYNKSVSLNSFVNITKQIFPVLNELIPQECLNSICEAQRKARGKGSIGDLSSSMKNRNERI